MCSQNKSWSSKEKEITLFHRSVKTAVLKKMHLLKLCFIISAAVQSNRSHGAPVAWESMRECMKEFPSVRLFERRSSCWRGAGSVTSAEVRARPGCGVTALLYFMPKNRGRCLQRGQSRRRGSPEITPAHWSFLILHHRQSPSED